MKSVLVQCWLGGSEVMNLGEWFIEIILAKFGYATRYNTRGRIEDDEPVLMVIGSDFHSKFLNQQLAELDARPREIHVWGAGNGRGPGFEVRNDPRVVVHAVRGSLTAEWNGCGFVPTCDPGFLLPWAMPIEREPSGEVLYVPHWTERGVAEQEASIAAKWGATACIDVMMRRDDVAPTIRRLVHANRVITSAMHAYILCLAYGVPVSHTFSVLPWKWQDMFSSLSIVNRQRLIDSFPHFLARKTQ